MIQYLLPQEGNFYKANLHCHTTCSDGRFTPEEVKAMYTEKGYQVIAFTDHNKLIPHNDLTDENFLAINGLEIGYGEYPKGDPRYTIRRNCDIGMLAPNPQISEHVPYATGFYETAKTLETMKRYRDAGFFVIYNHPGWSMERYPDYGPYVDMHAMEIFNYGSYVCGFEESNSRIYDDMLIDGKRIYCVATDDNHNKLGRPDSFGGFTVIKAPRLDYPSVMEALFAGHFYASQGPEIKSIYVDEENVFHVETSPATFIAITSPTKLCAAAYDTEGTGAPVTKASIQLESCMKYVRVTVTDANGKRAYSNAYFIDEIMK